MQSDLELEFWQGLAASADMQLSEEIRLGTSGLAGRILAKYANLDREGRDALLVTINSLQAELGHLLNILEV